MLNLSLEKIKSIINYENKNVNCVFTYPFLSMLWNVNTINQRKINKINDIIHSLGTKDNDDRAQTPILMLDLILIVEMGKISSKFNFFNINGYKLFTQLRTDRKGGGIGFYIKKDIKAAIKFTELTSDFEFLHMEITKRNDTPRNIVGVYRPPSGNKEAFYQALESLMMRNESNITIMGDINLNRPQDNDYNQSAKTYGSLLESFNLTVINNAITRYNKITQNHTIIDHVIVNHDRCDVLTLTTDNIVTNGFSDHNIIFIKEFGSSTEKITSTTSTQIKRINKKKVVESIRNNIMYLPVNIYPQTMCNNIIEFISSLIHNNTISVTLKNVDPNHELPKWMDITCVNYSNRVSNLQERIHELKGQCRPTAKLETKLRDLIKDKENYSALRAKAYYNDKAMLSTKESWKVVNHLTGRQREKNDITLLENGIRITDNVLVANIFQHYFMSIVGSLDKSPEDPVILGDRIIQTFTFDSVSTSEISNILETLDVGKATGIDGISSFILSQTSKELAKYIEILINQMLTYGKYPLKLKETIVYPIHKKDSKLNKENYRPVSVTNSLDKVIEEALLNQLNDFFSKHEILDRYQYGFKKRRSCEDILSKVLSIVSNIIDKRRTSIMISLDLSKAFDTVNHKILLAKLEHYGIRSKAYELLEDFLNNRVQYVKVNNAISFIGHLKRGIPQGTQKGPTLFSIYTNDMKELETHSRILKFADDTVLVFDIDPSQLEEASKQIHEDITLINEYYENNRLTLNLKKAQALIFGNVPQSLRTVLNDFKITPVENMKYLGIMIDDKLNFQTALSTLRKSLNQAIGAAYVMRQTLTVKPLMDFYFGHFQSHVTYCNFFLIRLTSKDIADLQILQNKILKLIHNLPPRTNTHEIYDKYAKNVLPIMGLIFKSICVMIKKSLIEQDAALVHIEQLRSNRVNKLKIMNYNTKIRGNDIEIIGVQIYNSLPDELRLIGSLNLFKSRIKSFLLSKNSSLASIQQIYTKNKLI